VENNFMIDHNKTKYPCQVQDPTQLWLWSYGM